MTNSLFTAPEPAADGQDPAAGADPAAAAGAAPAAADAAGGAPGHPEWLAEKFRAAENPVEAQARAYAEATRALAVKTETLKAEVAAAAKAEALAALKAEAAAPAAAADYALPEGLEADAPSLEAFRAKAHALGMSQAQFAEMARLYADTQAVDFAAETKKLGAGVEERSAAFSKWGSRHIPRELHGEVARIARTAEGFRVLETLYKAAQPGPALPEAETVEAPSAPTREKLNEMTADPRYRDPRKREPAFVASVEAYAARLAATRAKP